MNFICHIKTQRKRENRAKVMFVLTLLLVGCHADVHTLRCEWSGQQRPQVLHRLGCPADHKALSGTPATTTLPANRSVLFVIDRTDNHRIDFFDSDQWRHFSYASQMLVGYADLSGFNAEMYYQPGRRLLLGALTHHINPDIWAISVAPIDKASPDMLRVICDTVKSAIGWNADVRYHPSSNALEMPSRLPPDVPIVTNEDLFANAVYQAMNLGETVGRIKRVRLEELSQTYVSRMDIVVIDRVPNDISAVAGLVTSEFQTPLSHVNLLARSRGTPNMALRNAYDNVDIILKEGRWVRLNVTAEGYVMSDASFEEAEAFWDSKRPKKTQTPELDLRTTGLINVDEIDVTMIASVGGKAANYGELRNISSLPVPPGFAIPCSFHVDFMKQNGLDIEIENTLNDPQFRDDGDYRMKALSALRRRILEAPLNNDVETQIQSRAFELIGEGIPIRLRSSANAEDLAEFNGAGLYDSRTWDPDDARKPLASALKTVWASLWNLAAFEEREWARIDHSACAMGVLVHRSFPDAIEAANGVAITDNPFDPPPTGQAAYYINVQHGAVSVTNPAPGVTPQSFLYYKPPGGQGEMTVFTRSSLEGGLDVLSFAEIQSLISALKSVHDHFTPIYGRSMDVEFKLLYPDRTLIIKQARPVDQAEVPIVETRKVALFR